MKKRQIFLMFFLPLLFILILVSVVYQNIRKFSSTSTSLPPEKIPTPTILQISEKPELPTESQILNIESQAKKIKEELKSLIIKDSSSWPPNLDFGW